MRSWGWKTNSKTLQWSKTTRSDMAPPPIRLRPLERRSLPGKAKSPRCVGARHLMMSCETPGDRQLGFVKKNGDSWHGNFLWNDVPEDLGVPKFWNQILTSWSKIAKGEIVAQFTNIHQPFLGCFTTFDGILLLMYGFGPIPYSSVFLGSVWFFIGCHARIRCEEREGYPTFLLKWQFRTQCIEIGGTWKFLKDVQSTNGPKASRKERLVREKAR
jgi:hypothetical protein